MVESLTNGGEARNGSKLKLAMFPRVRWAKVMDLHCKNKIKVKH